MEPIGYATIALVLLVVALVALHQRNKKKTTKPTSFPYGSSTGGGTPAPTDTPHPLRPEERI